MSWFKFRHRIASRVYPEMDEARQEMRQEFHLIKQAAAMSIEGHPTTVTVDGTRRDDLACRCAGCTFARAAGLVPSGRGNRRIVGRGEVPF